MKRNYLLVLLSAMVLTLGSCKKHAHDEEGCMHTVDYWRTHPDEWTTNGFRLGHENYTNEQALVILYTPANGNYLLSVAQELIAMRLNYETVFCKDVADAVVGTEDHLFLETEEGELFPPFGTAFGNTEDDRDVANGLRRMNEGQVPTECCEEAGGKSAD